MYLRAVVLSLLLTSACAPKQVSVTTPATPLPAGQMGGASTATPASANGNSITPVPARVTESDTTLRPAWLKARIDAVLAERKRNPLTHIYSYRYKGQNVYYITAPCCDQYSEVFDARGKLLCNPDGGITGKGDGRCHDFEKNKSNEKLVWQDPR